MGRQIPNNFLTLAGDMVHNHVYLSVQRSDYSEATEYILRKRSPPGRLDHPRKVVVVVGAGVSNDACGLPLGESAARRLKDFFVNRLHVSPERIEHEIHRIKVEYRLGKDDFEAVLLALSKLDQNALLEELRKVYLRRHFPSLAYEVLAHWLKHRFIDAIVNFNFDEILDQAIGDELGSNGYYRVITDGDCPEDLIHWLDSDEDRFKLPLYIKPHGTASHKTTLRFTRSAYSLLPDELVNLLTRTFSGKVDVLILGHAMQSVEFNDILEHSGGDLQFYSIGYDKPDFSSAVGSHGNVAFWNSKTAGGLGRCIKSITSAVAGDFNEGFEPRSISRHKLIASLFGQKVDLNETEYQRQRGRRVYLRDRVYVEISLAVSKAKGFVSLEHLACGRAGKYFRDLRRWGGSGNSMLDMCRDLELQEFGYSRDTLFLPSKSTRRRLRCPILTETDFKRAARRLASRTKDLVEDSRRDKCSRALYAVFMEMYGGDEVEVTNDTATATNVAFKSPLPLVTMTSLRARTVEMIKASPWDSLLCSAESAQWLLKDEWSREIRRRRATLALIVADETHQDELQNKFLGQLGDRLRWLPWWLHNRHVTVLLSNKKATQAIYFERRLRTSHITPLALHDDDAQIAMGAFVAYWIKAEQFEKLGREIEIQPDQVNRASEELIEELWTSRLKLRSRH